MTPEQRRTGVTAARQTAAQQGRRLSERRACHLVGQSRSTERYRAHRDLRPAVRERLMALAAERPRFGYQRLHLLLRREGYRVNRKWVLRCYRILGLAVTRRRTRKRAAVPRVPHPSPTAALRRWSMDFVSDTLATGRSFRCLTIVDDYTRECPAIAVDTSLPAARVVQVLEQLAVTQGLPAEIVLDNVLPLESRGIEGRARSGATKFAVRVVRGRVGISCWNPPMDFHSERKPC